MVQARPGRSRAGFTLIECLAALGVFAAIILLWQPVTHLAQSLQGSDEEMTGIFAGARALENLTDGAQVAKTGNTITIDNKSKHYVVGWYSSKATPDSVRVTTDKGGFMPVMQRVAKFTVSAIAPGVVEYDVKTLSGKTFVGVLVNGGTGHAQTKR